MCSTLHPINNARHSSSWCWSPCGSLAVWSVTSILPTALQLGGASTIITPFHENWHFFFPRKCRPRQSLTKKNRWLALIKNDNNLEKKVRVLISFSGSSESPRAGHFSEGKGNLSIDICSLFCFASLLRTSTFYHESIQQQLRSKNDYDDGGGGGC